MRSGRKKLLLNEGVDDIISRLPRDLLDKIFERLPVKDAARTSILSRNWRYLWSAYPYLVFNKQFFETMISDIPDSSRKFVNVINKVLFGHDGPILKFEIHIPNLCDWGEHLDEWLLFLSRNGIQNLLLNYQYPVPYKLPSYVFLSPKMTSMSLVNVIFKPPVIFSGFANLVELHLKKVTFVASTFNGVSPVAPVLKKMLFISCTGINFFSISAPQAFVIAVKGSSEATPIFFDKFPNLSIIGIYLGEFLEGTPMNLCELQEKFSRVELLAFDGFYLKLSAAATLKRRLTNVFDCLKFLDLTDLALDDLDQISCALSLLNTSPNLGYFQARVLASQGSIVESVLTHFESPNCMSNMLNLQTVKLSLGEGSKPELVFIKCILAHSPNLKFLYVNYSVADEEKQLRISNEVMKFPHVQVMYGPWDLL